MAAPPGVSYGISYTRRLHFINRTAKNSADRTKNTVHIQRTTKILSAYIKVHSLIHTHAAY